MKQWWILGRMFLKKTKHHLSVQMSISHQAGVSPLKAGELHIITLVGLSPHIIFFPWIRDLPKKIAGRAWSYFRTVTWNDMASEFMKGEYATANQPLAAGACIGHPSFPDVSHHQDHTGSPPLPTKWTVTGFQEQFQAPNIFPGGEGCIPQIMDMCFRRFLGTPHVTGNSWPYLSGQESITHEKSTTPCLLYILIEGWVIKETNNQMSFNALFWGQKI